MNGQEKSIVDEKWQQFSTSIQAYIDSIGLNKLRYNEEVDDLLTISREQLYSMSAQSLGESAFLLAQYAACLQKEINNHGVKLNWSQHNLKIQFGRICSNYGTQYTPYEERKNMAINEDVLCKQLNIMVLMAGSRIKQLEFMSSKITSMQRTLTDLHQTKRNI